MTALKRFRLRVVMRQIVDHQMDVVSIQPSTGDCTGKHVKIPERHVEFGRQFAQDVVILVAAFKAVGLWYR